MAYSKAGVQTFKGLAVLLCKTTGGLSWAVVYDKAIREDGSLFFPERLSQEFLDEQKRTQGSYIFSNQYLNEVIPTDMQTFKREWFTYYETLPQRKTTFAFLDPAISEEDHADFTALTVVDVDLENKWYVRIAKKFKINVSQQINLVFKVQQKFNCNAIGVEDVAYQRALIQLLTEEVRKRRIFLPIVPVKRGPDQSKETRIRSLVPRIEWGNCLFAQGMYDLERELLKFPRGQHDDIIDSLQSIEDVAWPPPKIREEKREPAPNSPEYERYFIKKLHERSQQEQEGGDQDYLSEI